MPEIEAVETYERDILPNYGCPKSYVRFNRLSHEELRETLEYVIDAEDEAWLKNNTKFGSAAVVVVAEETTDRDRLKSLHDKQKIRILVDTNKMAPKSSIEENESTDPSPLHNTLHNEDNDNNNNSNNNNTSIVASDVELQRKVVRSLPKTTILPIAMLEIMLDVLEKATAFDAIISLDQAEMLILRKLPQFYHMYAVRAKAGKVTIRHVMSDVYQYWVSKRSKLKRPLIRRFWPVTSTDDTNPHLVFRPREKEKYKLRKKRQNDMDAYIKLQKLKHDFAQIRVMLGSIIKREQLNQSMLLLQKEWFEQKMYDSIDTSGLYRVSRDLDRRTLDKLLEVEKPFDIFEDMNSSIQLKRKNFKRTSEGSGRISPIPSSSLSSGAIGCSFDADSLIHHSYPCVASFPDVNPGLAIIPTKLPTVIAGQKNGEPAPSFLQPLATRESYATTWEGAVPHVTTIVDGRFMPTFRFRHRPRVGRGGRLCIDRVPLLTYPNSSHHNYFKAGSRAAVSYEPKERLLDLLPPLVDTDRISRRIEEICLSALKEDYDEHQNVSGSAVVPITGEGREDNDGKEVVVKMKDWLNTDEQLWGEERYAIGPI